MKRIKVTIRTEAPMILTDESNSTIMTSTRHQIAGSILRGLFAKIYIDHNGLHHKADADETFRRLFFGGLRFVDANPVKNGKRSFVMPLSLQKEKTKNRAAAPKIQDLLKTQNPELGYKSLKGMAVELSGHELSTVSPRTNISLHMSRDGAGERLLGSSSDGKLFNYESIDAGQTFAGYIYGEPSSLDELTRGIGEDGSAHDVHIGRSHFTQYGACTMTLSAPEPIDEPTLDDVHDGTIFLRLDTVFLPAMGASLSSLPSADDLLSPVATAMGAGFSVGDVYSAAAEVDNFVGVWGMKRPRDYGLAAGTVFALRKDTARSDDDIRRLSGLIENGIGRRREEGFGELSVWPHESFTLSNGDGDARDDAPIAISESVRRQIKSIISKKLLEEMRIYAGEDANKMHVGKSMTHFFARLSNLLDAARAEDAGHVRERLRNIIKTIDSHKDDRVHEKDKEDTKFLSNMRRIWVRDESLSEFLSGSAAMPYDDASRSWMRDIGDYAGGEDKNDLEQLLAEAGLSKADFKTDDGNYFYEYWHWLLRYARKKAATQSRGDA